MLFAILWITAFLDYCSRMILLVSVSSYYFDSSLAGEGSADVCYGFKVAFGSHMGSMALAAFIIAVVRLIRAIFLYLAKKAEKATGDNQVNPKEMKE